jgi:hypothetical protein
LKVQDVQNVMAQGFCSAQHIKPKYKNRVVDSVPMIIVFLFCLSQVFHVLGVMQDSPSLQAGTASSIF